MPTSTLDVLVVGSGGREHALGWKLAQSPAVGKVFTAPGNGGTANNVDIRVDDITGLAEFAAKKQCFTVVGSEEPLSLGLVDELESRSLAVFGPTKAAARLEYSKVWSKQFMQRHDIPTARFEVFDDPAEASEYAASVPYNVVIKADGLAAGKGVIVCDGTEQARAAIDEIMVKKKFGAAGRRIIVEERIDGVEASYIAMCDGETAVPMASSQDHKRACDGDEGPNTGGMGAYSPTPVVDDGLASDIQSGIIEKTVSAMAGEGIPLRGFLYAGIMVRDGRPYVLEFNARMGDPECQPIMARADFDLYEYLKAASQGRLDSLPPPRWSRRFAVCVVAASRGYPNKYSVGEAISGLDDVGPDSVVFHAGTRREGGQTLTSGGRVLGVTGLGRTLESAVSEAYQSVGRISWPSMYCRTDIGKTGLKLLSGAK